MCVSLSPTIATLRRSVNCFVSANHAESKERVDFDCQYEWYDCTRRRLVSFGDEDMLRFCAKGQRWFIEDSQTKHLDMVDFMLHCTPNKFSEVLFLSCEAQSGERCQSSLAWHTHSRNMWLLRPDKNKDL